MAETGNSMHVRLVAPDRVLVDETASAVEIPSRSGYLEVLYGHAPLLGELGAGHIRLHGTQGGDREFFVASSGFFEVLPDRVTILAASAKKIEELDQAQAEGELESGRKLWNEAGEDSRRYAEANAAIHDAETKLAAIQGSKF